MGIIIHSFACLFLFFFLIMIYEQAVYLNIYFVHLCENCWLMIILIFAG